MLKLYYRFNYNYLNKSLTYFHINELKLLQLSCSNKTFLPKTFVIFKFKNFPLSYIFFKYYYNNRPRINTYKPTFFLTFGLLKDYWDLFSRNLTKSNTKFLVIFLRKYILRLNLALFFNYFTKHSMYFLRLLFKSYNFTSILINYPQYTTYFYKYKKYKSIKKWVKKKLTRLDQKHNY